MLMRLRRGLMSSAMRFFCVYVGAKGSHRCEQELQVYLKLYHHAEGRLRAEHLRIVLLGQRY